MLSSRIPSTLLSRFADAGHVLNLLPILALAGLLLSSTWLTWAAGLYQPNQISNYYDNSPSVGFLNSQDGSVGKNYAESASNLHAIREVAKLTASDSRIEDSFGHAVSISGSTIVVGTWGAFSPFDTTRAAYVFEKEPGRVDKWNEVANLTASDAQAGDMFGFSVSISGDTIVVGAWSEDGGPGDPVPYAGAAYVFRRDEGDVDNWGEVTKLTASDAQTGDLFGCSVSISGNTIVVGAWNEDFGPGDPITNAGAAYVFERDQGGTGNWGEVAKLTASDAQAHDQFGGSVSISKDTIVVGVGGEDGGPGDPLPGTGAAYVFSRDLGGVDNWGEVTKITANDGQSGDFFGGSSSISDETIVARAKGAVYVFERNHGGMDNWGQTVKITASDVEENGRFSGPVAISADAIVVGSPSDGGGPGDPLPDSGAIYLFGRNYGGTDNWGEVAKLSASDSQVGDLFGSAVALSGETVVVGAYREDGELKDPVDAGAVYIFGRILSINKTGPATAITGSPFTYTLEVTNGLTKTLTATVITDVLPAGSNHLSGGTLVGDVISWTVPSLLAGNTITRQFVISATGTVTNSDYRVFTDEGISATGRVPIVTMPAIGELKKLKGSNPQIDGGFGSAVATSGETIVVGASWEAGGTDNQFTHAGVAYVFQKDVGDIGNWSEVARLSASDAKMYGSFGRSVDVNGNTIVVGTGYAAAYIFSRDQAGTNNWGEITRLVASDALPGDNFGGSVSISVDTVVLGAKYEDGGQGDPMTDVGAAYVFERDYGGTDNWGEVAKLVASDAQPGDHFGGSVAISGDTIVVGAVDAKSAYVFQRNEGGVNQWGQVAILTVRGLQTHDYFGASVSVSGDTIVVGTTGFEEAAYVFARNKGGADNWGQVAELRARYNQFDDRFGYHVSINGDLLVVGATREDGNDDLILEAGAAYVFGRNIGGINSWGEMVRLSAGDAQAEDWFGSAVSISGDTILVGASREDGGLGDPILDAGAAYIYGPSQRTEESFFYLPLVIGTKAGLDQ